MELVGSGGCMQGAVDTTPLSGSRWRGPSKTAPAIFGDGRSGGFSCASFLGHWERR